MLGLWVARVVHLDDRIGRLFALQTLTPVVYLPVYAVLVAAMVGRRWVLVLVGTVIAVSHIAWVLPDLPVWRSTTQATGATLTVAAANVAATNPSVADVADALMRVEADVIVVEELTPSLQAALTAAGFFHRYPHRVEHPRHDSSFGSAIYSAIPIDSAERFELAGLPSVRASLRLEGQHIDLVAVHTIQPLAGLEILKAQLAELTNIAMGSTGPLVMAGDFNAGRHHRPFRQLLATRMQDAHLARGRGSARTWPANRAIPPFTLIDHVLVSEDWAVRDISEFHLPGSDHRGIKASIQLQR